MSTDSPLPDGSATTGTTPVPAVVDASPLRGAVALAAVSMLCFGLLYPLAGVGIGRLLFPDQADGSRIARDGRVLGSSLVAQPFADARYFHPRPSAAGYDPMALAGSNQARTNPEMRARVEAARAGAARLHGVASSAVPSDLVTQSGSGIDPDIAPESAALQVERVARARGLPSRRVAALVAAHTEGRQFGMLGAPRVNVLELNLALDALPPAQDASPTRSR